MVNFCPVVFVDKNLKKPKKLKNLKNPKNLQTYKLFSKKPGFFPALVKGDYCFFSLFI